MQRWTVLVFVLVFLFACEQQVEQQPSPRPEPIAIEDIRIGFSMDTLVEDRWIKDRDLFKEAVEALGAEVVIEAANGDDVLQVAQAETLIQSGIDVLVIVPHNAEATAAIVHKAHQAGIKVISYDRLVKNADIDLYVSFDNERVGELQAEAMLQAVPQGNYVFIGGAATDNNAHLLKRGAFRVLQPAIDAGDVRVIYDQWTEDWTPVNARDNMREALEINAHQVDAVIASNDATGGGVQEALAIYGLNGKVPIAGQDADLAGIRRIVAGEQLMTVYKPIRHLSQTAAQLAVMLARGEEVEISSYVNNGKKEVPSVLIEPIAVMRDTIDSTVIQDGYHSYDDVYGN
ncbi:D-xylose transport system substrate-binding protein [Chryseomicrobium aureum]|uniref:sugar ABC transporter substrate-binding protein n=1 Tax=Chryseomicrobium aureum TaxID=1441723 RepID=UPI001EF9776E|nr:substrate-binding domain-containing protein [Chryseomicrobium aureum]MBM7707150.1 D-xylose transport system substrate-binding protein [Chryseomicrobium aureum]